MAQTYRIRDWGEHFETHESRKLKGLKWVAIPNKHDGEGYRRLMRQRNGPALYGAWVLLAAVASKCPIRGLLHNGSRPLTAEDIAIKTDCPPELVGQLLAFCTDVIRWLELVDDQSAALPADSAALTQKIPDTEPDQTGHNKTPEPEAGAFSKQGGRKPGQARKEPSVFAALKEPDLLDDEMLKRWYDFATSRPNPIVAASEVSLLRVFGAAVHAARAKTVGGRPVRSRLGLFGAIVSKGETAGGWSVITQAEEDEACKRLKRARSSSGR